MKRTRLPRKEKKNLKKVFGDGAYNKWKHKYRITCDTPQMLEDLKKFRSFEEMLDYEKTRYICKTCNLYKNSYWYE